jgi:hypothetical protein
VLLEDLSPTATIGWYSSHDLPRGAAPPSFPLVIQLALFYLPVHALSPYGAFQPNQCSLLDPSGGHPGNLFSILLITSAL